LLKINEVAIKIVLEKIYRKLHVQKLSDLEELILQIPEGVIDFTLSKWGVKQTDIKDLTERAFTKSRMANNIIDLNNDDILRVLKEVY
jgi:alcohol dehydrogenase class IV